jgi:hypothetical protein
MAEGKGARPLKPTLPYEVGSQGGVPLRSSFALPVRSSSTWQLHMLSKRASTHPPAMGATVACAHVSWCIGRVPSAAESPCTHIR